MSFRISDEVLTEVVSCIESFGYATSGKELQVIHHDARPTEKRLEQFAVRTEDDELLLAFRIHGDILTLDLARIDREHRRSGVLSKVTNVLRSQRKAIGVSRFGVAGVISESMRLWCVKNNMRKLDGAERWNTVPNAPIDYLMDWAL